MTKLRKKTSAHPKRKATSVKAKGKKSRSAAQKPKRSPMNAARPLAKVKNAVAQKSKLKKSTLKKSTLKKSTLKLEVCHNCLVAYDPAAGHLNCVPVTERQLFNQFDEDLRDAYYLIKDRVSEFGEQRMYNNARASMFSRRVCYLYVRPKKKFLEVCFFLPKLLKNEIIHDGRAVSKSKFTHTVRVFHSDQIDDTILTWLREAFEFAV